MWMASTGDGGAIKQRRLMLKQRRKSNIEALKQQNADGDPKLTELIERRRERNRKRNQLRKTRKTGNSTADHTKDSDNIKSGNEKIKTTKTKKKSSLKGVEIAAPSTATTTGDAAAEKLKSGRFRYINEQLYTSTGADAFELFTKDKEAFDVYHQGYRNQLKKWSCDPLRGIISKLKTRDAKGLIVADMGCGTARLAAALEKATVHSFDLVAANDRVTVADIAHVPLERDSVDVCVYCLSLMGTNLSEFLREASRILKTGGCLLIAEIVSRIPSMHRFQTALHQLGFELQQKKRIGGDMFVMFELTKLRRPFNKRPPGLKLLPCLYKKR